MRPLRRRALIIARPPRVAIRARKPILRTRLIFEGCHVIFISVVSYCAIEKRIKYHTVPRRSTRAVQIPNANSKRIITHGGADGLVRENSAMPSTADEAARPLFSMPFFRD